MAGQKEPAAPSLDGRTNRPLPEANLNLRGGHRPLCGLGAGGYGLWAMGYGLRSAGDGAGWYEIMVVRYVIMYGVCTEYVTQPMDAIMQRTYERTVPKYAVHMCIQSTCRLSLRDCVEKFLGHGDFLMQPPLSSMRCVHATGRGRAKQSSIRITDNQAREGRRDLRVRGIQNKRDEAIGIDTDELTIDIDLDSARRWKKTGTSKLG